MRVAIDGFGGDHAPLSILEGSAQAVREYGISITITGNESILREAAAKHQILLDGISFCHTDDVIRICDDPSSIMGEHQHSSMAVGMKMLRKGEADAFVSAGSTGALTVGAALIVKRLKGIKRVTIAALIPSQNGCYLLADAGANLNCRPEMLMQFAMMGSIYMNKIIGVERPRVGLLNIGEEENKGQELEREAYQLLKRSNLNFIGNVEPRDIPLTKADVVITDGFTGNVVLKLTEGFGGFITGMLKQIFLSGVLGRLAAALTMKQIKRMKQMLDYKEYGGAPLLGASKPVIKAHGSSNAYAIKNAIRQACDFVTNDINGQITRALEDIKQK